MRRDSLVRGIVTVLCVGMLAAGLALILLWHQVEENHRLVTQQKAVIADLSTALAQAQQGESELRRLVQALQQQVVFCQRHPHHCGPPLTVPPSQRTQPGTSGQTTGGGGPGATGPRASRSPRPSPSPTRSSPSPSPRPSPSICPYDDICLPPSPRGG